MDHATSGTFSALCQIVTRKTVVLWFAAAPPNVRPASDESKALSSPDAYDWVHLCRNLAAARVTVYPVMSSDATSATLRVFAFAAAMTGGACVVTPDTSTASTTRTTINLLVGTPC
jgi:hypothetical protein